MCPSPRVVQGPVRGLVGGRGRVTVAVAAVAVAAVGSALAG